MNERDPIGRYLTEVRRRVRWRRDRARVLEEVADHLAELASHAEARGASRAEAARGAVERLGRPSLIVPRRRWPRFAAATTVMLVTVTAIGVVSLRPSGGHNAIGAARDGGLSARLVGRELGALQSQWTRDMRHTTLRQAATTADFPLYRPDDVLASDQTINGVWVFTPMGGLTPSAGPTFTIVYRSALVCSDWKWIHPGAGEVLPELHRMAKQQHGRFTWINGSPAVVVASNPKLQVTLGYPPPMWQFGTPASVTLVKNDIRITLERWGANTLPGVIAAARTLTAPTVPPPSTLG